MSKIRSFLALTSILVALPAMAAQAEGYTAKIKVTDGETVVTRASTYAQKGDPVRMGLHQSQQYGGKDGPYVETGFRFEMLPQRHGDAMQIEVNLTRTELTDADTGAVREEASVIQGDATRDGDGWTYETDRLPGGKVLKLTLTEANHPEWDLPKAR